MEKKVEDMKLFGRVLRDLREESGKTQEILAMDAALDRTYISKMERGESSPTFGSLVALSEALGVPLSQVFLRFEKTKDVLNQL